jgi:DNA polymerase (family 10)
MRLEEAKQIATRVRNLLTPYCERIEIAGSIRREKPNVHDIDIVLIEKPESALIIPSTLASIGTITLNGSKIKRLHYGEASIDIDIYIATPASWSTLLLIRTGSKENNIRLAMAAMRKGWQLKANGDGLFNEQDERIAGDTEQSIYQALGIPYQEPQKR